MNILTINSETLEELTDLSLQIDKQVHTSQSLQLIALIASLRDTLYGSTNEAVPRLAINTISSELQKLLLLFEASDNEVSRSLEQIRIKLSINH